LVGFTSAAGLSSSVTLPVPKVIDSSGPSSPGLQSAHQTEPVVALELRTVENLEAPQV
jgi:hypothetical protein